MIDELEKAGFRPRIQDAWRSEVDQLKAYNAGRSELEFSFHNITGKDGKKEALAVDLLDDNAPIKVGSVYVLRLAGAAKHHGLTTGARFGVPPNVNKAIDDAIDQENWKALVKFGWDPCHVQPTGITVDQARAGKRPS